MIFFIFLQALYVFVHAYKQLTKPAVTINVLTKQIDELVENLNELKQAFGMENATQKHSPEKLTEKNTKKVRF